MSRSASATFATRAEFSTYWWPREPIKSTAPRLESTNLMPRSTRLVPRQSRLGGVVPSQYLALAFYRAHSPVELWQILRFGPPKTISPGVEVIEGTFVRGNVKDASVIFTLRQLDENFTVLTCDLLIIPSIPAPQAAVDEELRDSALKAVDALHTRAQGGNNKTVAYTGPVASNK